jgi:quercetin dioxygenase-like cupin family protein
MNKSDFFSSENLKVEDLGNGLKRQILGFDSGLMMVKVFFEKGAIGNAHHHSHRQVSYVDSGVFEVSIGDKIQTLIRGESIFVTPDKVHGVVCLEPGVLIDVFTPAREDFLEG